MGGITSSGGSSPSSAGGNASSISVASSRPGQAGNCPGDVPLKGRPGQDAPGAVEHIRFAGGGGPPNCPALLAGEPPVGAGQHREGLLHAADHLRVGAQEEQRGGDVGDGGLAGGRDLPQGPGGEGGGGLERRWAVGDCACQNATRHAHVRTCEHTHKIKRRCENIKCTGCKKN